MGTALHLAHTAHYTKAVAAGTTAVRPKPEHANQRVHDVRRVRRARIVPAATWAEGLLERRFLCLFLFLFQVLVFDLFVSLLVVFEFGLSLPVFCHSQALVETHYSKILKIVLQVLPATSLHMLRQSRVILKVLPAS